MLADEKIDKINTITKLKALECFTYMSYKKDIDFIRKQEHEQQMLKYGR